MVFRRLIDRITRHRLIVALVVGVDGKGIWEGLIFRYKISNRHECGIPVVGWIIVVVGGARWCRGECRIRDGTIRLEK